MNDSMAQTAEMAQQEVDQMREAERLRVADFNVRYNMSGKNLKAKYRGGSR